MLPILQIGPLALQTPGLIIIIGLWLGINIAERKANVFHVDPGSLINLITITSGIGLIGARVIYAIEYLEFFVNSPINLISLNSGLLDPIGGIGVGILTGLIYFNRKGLSFLPTLDALTPFFAVVAISISLANFASGDAYGIATKLPIGIELWGTKRIPIQLIDFLFGGFILWVIWPWNHHPIILLGNFGSTFVMFLAMHAASQLFLDPFRDSSEMIYQIIRPNQFLALIMLALSLLGLKLLRRPKYF